MEAEFRKRRGKLIKAFDEAEEAENYDALEQIQMKLINFTFARYLEEKASEVYRNKSADDTGREKTKKKKKKKNSKKKMKQEKREKSEEDVHYF